MMPANAPLGVSSRRAKTMVWLPSIRLLIGTDVLRRPSSARPRGLEVVAIGDIDVRRRPGRGRDDELSVLVRDHDVEDVRQRGEMRPHRLVHLPGAVDRREPCRAYRCPGPCCVLLISSSIASIVCSDRDNWPARIAAMFPVSAIADLMASLRSCQIVKPTAPTDRPSSTIAAHHRRRSGIDFGDGACPLGASCARSMSAAVLSSMPVEPSRRPSPALRVHFYATGAEHPLKVLG